MSCLPGMQCWDVLVKTLYSNDCDPCSTWIVKADKVEYLSSNLPCTGINTGDTLETALQKIDEKMCSDELVAHILAAIEASSTLKATLCAIIADC